MQYFVWFGLAVMCGAFVAVLLPLYDAMTFMRAVSREDE